MTFIDVTRHVDIVGRVSALVIGTFAIEMIVQGIETLVRND